MLNMRSFLAIRRPIALLEVEEGGVKVFDREHRVDVEWVYDV